MTDAPECKREMEISDMRHVLYGNGKPEEGVVYRLRRMEDRQRRLDRFFWLVLGAAISAVFTGAAVAAFP